MEILLYILYAIMIIAVAAVLIFIIYFICSPMPVIKKLRGGMDGQITYPEGQENLKDNVKIKKDIIYSSKYGKNSFDLYLPKTECKVPLIMWVHGGAFVAGDKSGTENWAVVLANNGYAVASINYEWAPEASYPAQIIQITEALQAVNKIAKESENIDMSRIALAGDSAGAHMAAQFALIHTNPEFSKRMKISSPLEKGALKCVLLYCGPYNLEKMFGVKNRLLKLAFDRIGWSYLGQKNWRKSHWLDTLTLVNYVTENYVPSYITDGNNFSFESHGMEFGEKLKSLGVPVVERYFPKEQFGEVNHEYQMDLTQKNAMDCLSDTLEFLNKYV